MIPLAIPHLAGREAAYLQECIDSTFVSSVGPFVDRFEKMVAQAAGCRTAVATASGTTGLHAALTALGVGRDDLVIVPTWTFIASANAVAHCGAMPWLLDVERQSWNLDPDLLLQALDEQTEHRSGKVIHTASGRRVAAIMPVHGLGTPANMPAIVDCAKKFNLPVLADAAAALGATCNDQPVGRMGADLTVFSFNGNKTITAGGGGAVTGTDEKLLDTVRHLTTTARHGSGYDHDRIGFNYRMTNLQAAVGCAQMERLPQLLAAKKRIYEDYRTGFADRPDLTPFPVPPWGDSAHWLSGVFLENIEEKQLEPLLNKLQKAGIGVRSFWKPIHQQVPYAKAPKWLTGVADDIWYRILPLPSSSGLTREEGERVVSTVKKFSDPSS